MASNERLLIFVVIVIINLLPWCYSEVKLIQATIRHADRNPLPRKYSHLYYPNDPYKNCDWTPDGAMELTNPGKRNAYNLGKFFRKRYGTLIDSIYKPSNVYFHAAQMSRTINTIQLVAAGLFPPHDNQIWNSKLLWIPIPIHFTPVDEDILNYSLTLCENYFTDQVKSETEINRLFNVLDSVRSFYDFLGFHTGVNYTKSKQGWILYHQLAAQTGLGLKLEPWTETIYPNGKLVDISAVEYILQTYTDRMKRLVGGVWIKLFLDHIDDMITGKNDQCRAYFYSSNEIQIAAILNVLGVYKAHVPNYTSAIIFELHEIDKKLYIKVIYRNEEVVIDFTIPGCPSSICPLSIFKSALKNVTMNNFKEDCGNRVNIPIV